MARYVARVWASTPWVEVHTTSTAPSQVARRQDTS